MQDFRAVQKQNYTVFFSKDTKKLTDLLKLSGVENIGFRTNMSKITSYSNRKLNTEQIKAYRYQVSKLGLGKKALKVSNKSIIRGFEGCLITGHHLKFY